MPRPPMVLWAEAAGAGISCSSRVSVMGSSTRKPIARARPGEVIAAGALILFFLVGFALDPADGVPVAVAIGLATVPAALLWRMTIGGVYCDGTIICVANLTRTVRVEIGDIVEVGPPPEQMGRLYLVVRPDNRRVRMSVSPQAGVKREQIRASLLRAIARTE